MEWSWGRGLAHTDPTLILLLMMINLTEFGRKVVGISECSECSEYSDFQSSHRSNKIQQKIICENLC